MSERSTLDSKRSSTSPGGAATYRAVLGKEIGMKNLDSAFACIETSSIAAGYRVLATVLSRPAGAIRVLEASQAGARFCILALGEIAELRQSISRARGAAADAWVGGEAVETKSRDIAESFFSLPQQTLSESLVVLESESVAAYVAVAHELVEVAGLMVLESRILRSSSGGAYGFFTGSAAVCGAAAENARAKLSDFKIKGRIEKIDSLSPEFREFFEIKGG